MVNVLVVHEKYDFVALADALDHECHL